MIKVKSKIFTNIVKKQTPAYRLIYLRLSAITFVIFQILSRYQKTR